MISWNGKHGQVSLIYMVRLIKNYVCLEFCFSVQQRVLCKEGLSKTDQDICDTAIFVFTSVCMTVLDGSVTFDVLHKLQKRQILVEKLCQAIFSNTCDIESSLKVQTLSFREVISTLEVRLKEYETFSLLRDQISTLSCHVPEVIVPG